MGKKDKRNHDDPELELEPELTERIDDGDLKKKTKKKKRSHDDPEQKVSLDGDAKKKKKKKKKSKEEEEEQTIIQEEEKPNGEEKKKEGGRPTVTIAIAGSIINNTQSLELATRVTSLSPSLLLGFSENLNLLLNFLSQLAGQIARASTIFRIDEVHVVADCIIKNYSKKKNCTEFKTFFFY